MRSTVLGANVIDKGQKYYLKIRHYTEAQSKETIVFTFKVKNWRQGFLVFVQIRNKVLPRFS